MNIASDHQAFLQQIEDQGYALVPSVFSGLECRELTNELDVVLANDECMESIRSSRGTVFAARNIIELMPSLADWWKREKLLRLLGDVLGDQVGLVRCLYFDKPSHRSWSLPFHKDMTIAVKQNRLPGTEFAKPTIKAGIPHVEASRAVLESMLTLRIHLDQVTEQNGPLQVIAGSHLNGKESAGFSGVPDKIICRAGDVLAMRPLISHASGHSDPDANLHRRILHLEFAGIESLPDAYEWQWWEKVR